MPFYEKGDVRIRYEETGSGFPLLVTPGGGLNSKVSNWPTAVFNAMEAFKNDFRCITMDQRNANGGDAIRWRRVLSPLAYGAAIRGANRRTNISLPCWRRALSRAPEVTRKLAATAALSWCTQLMRGRRRSTYASRASDKVWQ
jgi:pimeloyl-ACP methyl ester carboxylesterase